MASATDARRTRHLDESQNGRHSETVVLTLDLDQMTVQERIQAMEQLWNSLLQDEDGLESPSWHREVLDQRRQRIESGEARFLTIEELRKLKSA